MKRKGSHRHESDRQADYLRRGPHSGADKENEMGWGELFVHVEVGS